MDKTYDPITLEKYWYERWEKAGAFSPSGSGTPYCIMLPPPNVTGSLHMGHGFQHTLMDILIRYHRMMGDNTLWQGGTDHAGIATQLVVERQLEKQGINPKELGREKFIEKTWDWKKTSGNTISNQMRRMGSSIDWSRERFTMDEPFSHAVNTAFEKLHTDGLIYKGKRLVNWDITLQTAISDLEVITVEEPGKLWTLKYYLVDNPSHYLTIATTRPETLFGDVAIAVNPHDARYKEYIGQSVKLPLTDRVIPVISDEYVDPEFGTGCVKITPAHDFNDYEVGKRHNLALINILNPDGTLNNLTPYQNIDRLKARIDIIKKLTELHLLEKTEEYTVKIPRSDRTHEIIEPLLTDQWYIKMTELAKPAIEAVKSGQIKFIPENWTKTYLQWLENIQDWCISRQLWWGHSIPHSDDVLDTWFSSALWPFATLGWPNKTPELEAFYPTSVLITGFDIIFFWVARMVMFGLYFTGKVPFHEIYITGLIRDQHGQKMSKSKGNVLDPIDLIDGISLNDLIQKRITGLLNPKMEQAIIQHTQKEFPEGIPAFGTDALRMTYCALANTGRDIRFDMGRIGGYRNFCNKLWNATRFVLMTLGEFSPSEYSDNLDPKTIQDPADQWILSRLQKTIQLAHVHLKNYRFDLLAQILYEFTWQEYCDWYLEFSKITTSPHKNQVLIFVLKNILKLLHPIMPYITEEIWQNFSKTSIQHEKYPPRDLEFNSQEFNDAEYDICWLQKIITSIRNLRSEMQITPSKKILLFIKNYNTENPNSTILEPNKLNKRNQLLVEKFTDKICHLTRVEKIEWLGWGNPPPTQSSTAVIYNLQLFIPLDIKDKQAEQDRLQKEIAKIKQELEKIQHKLTNEDYVTKAPASVVNKERERAAEYESTLTALLKRVVSE